MAEKFMTVTWAGSETADGYELFEQNKGENNLLVSVFDPSLTSIEVPVNGHHENTFFVVPFRMNRAKREYEKAVQAEAKRKNPVNSIVKAKPEGFTAEVPVLKKAESMHGGVYISWSEVAGVPQYRVFRKSGREKWSRIRDVTSAFYLDRSVEGGVVYTYTVRCLNADGTVYLSDHDKKGIRIRYRDDSNLERTRL